MILFNDLIFGPIHSRRLGLSLGVNLLPVDAKICSFDCIYCECGYNTTIKDSHIPTRKQVRETLEAKLTEMKIANENKNNALVDEIMREMSKLEIVKKQLSKTLGERIIIKL